MLLISETLWNVNYTNIPTIKNIILHSLQIIFHDKMKHNNNAQYHLDVLESSTHAQSAKYKKNVPTYIKFTFILHIFYVQ